jgi:mycoredoxin
VKDRKFICPCYRHERDIAETGHCICHLFVNDEYEPMGIGSPPIRQEGDRWPDIVVYGAYWCQDTMQSRKFLNRQGVPYTFVDVEEDAEAAQKVKECNEGNLSTPTLEIDGRIVVEPSDEALAEILDLAD